MNAKRCFDALRRSGWAFLAVSLVLGGDSSGREPDEIDVLIRQLNVPKRFAEHRPEFTVKEADWTVDDHSGAGPRASKVFLTMDRDRYVAVWSQALGRVDLVTHDPHAAPKRLDPPARYHIARLFGAAPTTGLWVFGKEESGSTEWVKEGSRVIRTRKREWTKEFKGHVVSKTTLECDSALGYVVTIEQEIASDKRPPARAELLNIFMANVADPWPGRGRWDLTFFSPEGQPGYRGWANNWVAGEWSDNGGRLRIRHGGLVGFANADGGWCAFVTRTGTGAFSNATCNVWLDQHNHMTLAEKPDGQGMYVSRATFRVGFAPPEITADVLERCPLEFKGSAAVMPRVGVLEDFESQPQPLTSPVRGLRMDGLALTAEKAHSGKYAVVLKGTANRDSRGVFSIAPQIPLDADATYRIEAWALVEQPETEASITADLYTANVHHKDRLRRQQTGAAAGPCDWQKIELEFSTRGLGLDPFLDLRFRVVGPGKAFFDDLHFRKITPKEPRHE